MGMIEKWWVRFIISIVLAGFFNELTDLKHTRPPGSPVIIVLTMVIYIVLSVVYGFSSHNRNKKKPQKKSEEILDEE